MSRKQAALAMDLRNAADRAKSARGGDGLMGAIRIRDLRLAECEALLRLLAILIDDYGPERDTQGRSK